MNCSHEDNITYNKLTEVDGEPLDEVKCESCGATGVIHLVEDQEEWGASS
jgi:hypothetical protein